MSYQNIPKELRDINQWLVWKYEDIGAKKPTKVPYNPLTGKMAAVDDPNTWTDFKTAVSFAAKYSGIGFVFTNDDPYTFIDLDDTDGDQVLLSKQIEIYKEFNSYSEISPSGKGLHVIIRGKVLAGRKRNYIEIYSSLRYVTFTGNIYNNEPIKNCQDLLTQVWQSMGSGPATYVFNGEAQETQSDQSIIEQASKATNGEKFKHLFDGQWTDTYSSQSEADFALIDIVAFYTKNRNQILRIFRSSQLGKRDKANRKDYVERMILQSFDRMLPPLDFDGFKNALENKLAEQKELPLSPVAQRSEPIAHNGLVEGSNPSGTTNGASSNGKTAAFEAVNLGSIPSVPAKVELPIGLMGEIAQFIYASAPRPVPEIALAASIGLMAGICGQAYNISGTGLNQYIILIAQTGVGKESMASGIDKLMNSIRFLVPTSIGIIGPSNIASGQAIVKHLSKSSSCFVSILGEFGLRLQQISAYHASSAERSLKIMLLDLYNKSGHGQSLRPSIYADTEKNTLTVEAPSFSILAESTPSTFFGALNEEMINEGLLPRFMIVEYNGKRPELNEDHVRVNPPNWLTDKIATLVAQCETISHHKRVINIQTHEAAQVILRKFDKFCDAQINNTANEIMRHLWSRAHMKVLKMAGLLAVGVNFVEPLVTAANVEWAINMAKRDIEIVTAKFEAGEIGNNSLEIRQQQELVRAIREYFNGKDAMTKYKASPILHEAKIIPYQYFNRRLIAIAAFRNDKNGATNAIRRTLKVMTDSDKLREVNKNELAVKYGTTQQSFVVKDLTILD